MFRATNKSRLTLTTLERRDVPAVMPLTAQTPILESPESGVGQMAATLSDKTMIALEHPVANDSSYAARGGQPRHTSGIPMQDFTLVEIAEEAEQVGVAKAANPDRR